MVKLVYTYALGAYAFGCAGSSPVSRTIIRIFSELLLERVTFSFTFFNSCLWQELRNVNQKIAQKGDDWNFYSEMMQLYDVARTYFSTKQ